MSSCFTIPVKRRITKWPIAFFFLKKRGEFVLEETSVAQKLSYNNSTIRNDRDVPSGDNEGEHKMHLLWPLAFIFLH